MGGTSNKYKLDLVNGRPRDLYGETVHHSYHLSRTPYKYTDTNFLTDLQDKKVTLRLIGILVYEFGKRETCMHEL